MKPNTSHDTKETVSRVNSSPHDAVGLARGVVHWLISRQMPSGGIRGSGVEASPSDHYAHSFGALAMALVAEADKSPHLWEQSQRAADYTIGLPGHTRSAQEFNSLALLMLTRVVQASATAPGKMRDSLETQIMEPSFLYDGSRLVSNNWVAMRAVCFLLHARLTTNERSLRRGEDLLRETLRWQLEDGVFVDYPRKPQGCFATPLTYHAKMCAMLALAADYT